MEFIKEHLKLVFQELKTKISFTKVIKIIGAKQNFDKVIDEVNLNKRSDESISVSVIELLKSFYDPEHFSMIGVDYDDYDTEFPEHSVLIYVKKNDISLSKRNIKLEIKICEACGNYTLARHCHIFECVKCKCEYNIARENLLKKFFKIIS
jgi:hypothetical protein